MYVCRHIDGCVYAGGVKSTIWLSHTGHVQLQLVLLW